MAYCICLLSLSAVFSRFIHVVTWLRTPFLLFKIYSFILFWRMDIYFYGWIIFHCMDIPLLFTPSSVDVSLGYFYF